MGRASALSRPYTAPSLPLSQAPNLSETQRVPWRCGGLNYKAVMGVFSWLSGNPEQKLHKQIAAKSETALQFQRNGKMKEFAEASAEVAKLEQQLDALVSAKPGSSES